MAIASSGESGQLISADKVEGTSVYNLAGDKVGTIRNIFIDKTSGKVVYASLAFGGILGVGAKYHALPWSVLTYNTELGGYQCDVNAEKLQSAPAASEDELVGRLGDQSYGREIHDYYGARPYWS